MLATVCACATVCPHWKVVCCKAIVFVGHPICHPTRRQGANSRRRLTTSPTRAEVAMYTLWMLLASGLIVAGVLAAVLCMKQTLNGNAGDL